MTREQEERYFAALPAGMSNMVECRTVLDNALRMLGECYGYLYDNAPREIEDSSGVVQRAMMRLECQRDMWNDRIKDAEEEAYQAATKGA